MFQPSRREHREALNNRAQALAENQPLEICDNSLPFVVIWVREPLKRQFGRKESIFWRDSVVAEDRDRRQHASGGGLFFVFLSRRKE